MAAPFVTTEPKRGRHGQHHLHASALSAAQLSSCPPQSLVPLAQPSLVLLRMAAACLGEVIRCVRSGALLGHGPLCITHTRHTRPAR